MMRAKGIIVKRKAGITSVVVVAIAVIVVVGAAAVYFTFPTLSGSSGHGIIKVRENSTAMEPAIPVDSTVSVNTTFPFNQLKIGDVIFYNPPAGCLQTLSATTQYECSVIGRVVKIQTVDGIEMLTTKGDNNPFPLQGYNYNITQTEYIGKVLVSSAIPETSATTASSPSMAILTKGSLVAGVVNSSLGVTKNSAYLNFTIQNPNATTTINGIQLVVTGTPLTEWETNSSQPFLSSGDNIVPGEQTVSFQAFPYGRQTNITQGTVYGYVISLANGRTITGSMIAQT